MDEPVEIPWGVALRLFKSQLIVKLTKEHRYSPKEAIALVEASYKSESEIIKPILKEIIENEKSSRTKSLDRLFTDRCNN